MQVLFFILPILGLMIVADGVIRFGTALTNKQERGQKWQVAMASTYSGHVIVCGMGRVGYRVALELLKYGREVVAVEADEKCRFAEKAMALGIPVIFADARRQENLIKAGIEQADAIIPCTNDELGNLDIALDARELNPILEGRHAHVRRRAGSAGGKRLWHPHRLQRLGFGCADHRHGSHAGQRQVLILCGGYLVEYQRIDHPPRVADRKLDG